MLNTPCSVIGGGGILWKWKGEEEEEEEEKARSVAPSQKSPLFFLLLCSIATAPTGLPEGNPRRSCRPKKK